MQSALHLFQLYLRRLRGHFNIFWVCFPPDKVIIFRTDLKIILAKSFSTKIIIHFTRSIAIAYIYIYIYAIRHIVVLLYASTVYRFLRARESESLQIDRRKGRAPNRMQMSVLWRVVTVWFCVHISDASWFLITWRLLGDLLRLIYGFLFVLCITWLYGLITMSVRGIERCRELQRHANGLAIIFNTLFQSKLLNALSCWLLTQLWLWCAFLSSV